jgi:hypothetical protein
VVFVFGGFIFVDADAPFFLVFDVFGAPEDKDRGITKNKITI